MGRNRVGWRKLILVAVILGFVALIILALHFYDRIAFAFYYRVVENDYGEYELVEVKRFKGETVCLPEKTPDGKKITILCPFWKKDSDAPVTELIIPDTYRQIREGVGSGLKNLRSVQFGAGVETVYGGLFCESTQLEQLIVSAGNKKYYSSGNCVIDKETQTVVLGCKSSTIPDGVFALGEAAFANIRNLEHIVIPSSVQTIRASCFWRCDRLQTVIIPSTVGCIEKHAFTRCSMLTVFCEYPEKPEKWDSEWIDPENSVCWNYNGVAK